MTDNRRKNYFIKKRFQIGFLYRFIILILLEAVLIAALLMLVSKGTLTTAYYGSRIEIEATPSFFLKSFIIIALAAAAAISLCGLLIFIYLSHRIAGPLYKFEKTIGDISKGDVSFRVNLRKTDQLQNLQGPLNSMLGAIDERVKEMKKYIHDGIEAADNNSLEERVARANLKDILSNLRKITNFFKTSK